MAIPTRGALIDPAGYDLQAKRAWAWAKLERLAGKADSEMVQLLALREYLDRTDPKKNALELSGPVTFRWATSDEAPSFPMLPAPSKPPSTPASKTNGHAPPSLSVTDDSASLL